MFGKRNQDNSAEEAELALDSMPQQELTPTTPDEKPVVAAPPPDPKPEPAPQPVPQPVPQPIDTSATDTELSRLRDILFGGQARSTEKRMGDLELRLESVRQDLTDLIEQKVGNLDQTAGNQLAATRTDFVERLNMKTESQSKNLYTVQQELSDRLDQQNTDLTTQIRTTQRELSDRLESQQIDQSTQLRTVQKELSQRLDTLSADFMAQLRQIQKELSDRLDNISETQTEQSRTIQAESKQRDDELRQELMTFASLLESKKVSRTDLGQMLSELGQRMRSDTN